jgi:hypothetical protein
MGNGLTTLAVEVAIKTMLAGVAEVLRLESEVIHQAAAGSRSMMDQVTGGVVEGESHFLGRLRAHHPAWSHSGLCAAHAGTHLGQIQAKVVWPRVLALVGTRP